MRQLVLLVFLVGCGGSTSTAANPGAMSAPAEAPPAPDKPAELPKVQVAADGTQFDPPVSVAELPDGAYYCDMGTVHYARMDKGDDGCPVCGMDLSHDDHGKKEDKTE